MGHDSEDSISANVKNRLSLIYWIDASFIEELLKELEIAGFARHDVL